MCYTDDWNFRETYLKTESQQHPVYISKLFKICGALKIPLLFSTKSFLFKHNFALNK